jgi:hypothetical protein
MLIQKENGGANGLVTVKKFVKNVQMDIILINLTVALLYQHIVKLLMHLENVLNAFKDIKLITVNAKKL